MEKTKVSREQSTLSPIQDVGHVKEQRQFVREKFFPLLCKSTESINDADIFLQTFSTMLMETFLHKMKEGRFKDLQLDLKLDVSSPKHEVLSELVHLFDDMSIQEAQNLIDGMKNELRSFYTNEMKTRKLDSLQVNWLE